MTNFFYVLIGDTGSGIEPQNLSNVFQPYFSTKASGSGLGLMIVNRILRDHGGQVGIDSKTGLGTVISLKFPKKTSPGSVVTGINPLSRTWPTARLVHACIHTHCRRREAYPEGLQFALEDTYDVYLASNADQAFNLLDSQPFDVLLTDLRMSGKSGMKVIDQALTLPHKPICIHEDCLW